MSFNVHVYSLLHIKILTIRSSNFFLNKNKWNSISGSGGVQAGKCHVNASPHGCLEVSIPDFTSCTYPFVFPQHCFPSQCTRLVSQAKILGVSLFPLCLSPSSPSVYPVNSTYNIHQESDPCSSPSPPSAWSKPPPPLTRVTAAAT